MQKVLLLADFSVQKKGSTELRTSRDLCYGMPGSHSLYIVVLSSIDIKYDTKSAKIMTLSFILTF